MVFTDNTSTPSANERESTIIGNNSSAEQILDLITVSLSNDSTSLSMKELPSVKTDSELSSTNPAKITFTTPYELTEGLNVRLSEEQTEYFTPTVSENPFSSNDVTNENPTTDLMEITTLLNETTPDGKLDISTINETNAFTIFTTSNAQTEENDTSSVEYNNNITTETNSLTINETFITKQSTFITQPSQTMTEKTTTDKKLDIFTVNETDTFTESLGIFTTSNVRTVENNSISFEYNMNFTSETNSYTLKETFLTKESTFVTQPGQTLIKETTTDGKLDISTTNEPDTFTDSQRMNTSTNAHKVENNSISVEYNNNIATETIALTINETFITNEFTSVTQPDQTMTNPAENSKEIDITFPSTADFGTTFEENTYDIVNYNFTSSPDSILSNNSYSVSNSITTEQQENKSTVELTFSQNMIEKTSYEVQTVSSNGDFQSSIPSDGLNNMTFKHEEFASSPQTNTLSSDGPNAITMQTEYVSEIVTLSSEFSSSTQSTIAEPSTTGEFKTQQTNDVNVTAVVDLKTIHSILENITKSSAESTLEVSSESSSKPSSDDLTTIAEEINSNDLSTESNNLNSNSVSSKNYSLLSTPQKSLGTTESETMLETLYTSHSDQTFTNKMESLSTLQSATENVTLSKGTHSTQGKEQFSQNISRESLTLDIISSTVPKTVPSETEPKLSTQFTLQKYSDLSLEPTKQSEQSTKAITELINLTTNTIKYPSVETQATTTEGVIFTEKSDNYMSKTQMSEYSNNTHVSKPQTPLIDVGSPSESSGLSTTRRHQPSTNFLSQNVTESKSLSPTDEHPTLPSSGSTSYLDRISSESSTSPTSTSAFSSSTVEKTSQPSSSITLISNNCQSRYFLDTVGELVIEVKSKYQFNVVKKELMDIVWEYGVTDVQVKFNFTFQENMYIVWMRFDSRTLPLKIIEINEIAVKSCMSLQRSDSGTQNVELHKETSSGSVAAIVVALLYFSTLLIIAFILIHRKYKQRLKVGSTTYLSEKTCSTRATMETNFETESEC
ncbi:mucin-2-like [Saccostrea cucullata]|uniref:mucin-2-like n=1 Tax=Saccostrea cuccullata TaxID=36930 RepID=UPI002ED1FB07